MMLKNEMEILETTQLFVSLALVGLGQIKTKNLHLKAAMSK